MTSLEKTTKIACGIGFLVGMGGFITCLFTEDMFGALTWGVAALVNQNAMNATN